MSQPGRASHWHSCVSWLMWSTAPRRMRHDAHTRQRTPPPTVQRQHLRRCAFLVRSARTQREEEPFPHRQATLSRWGQGSDGSMGSDACGMDSRAARTSFRLIPSPFFRVPPLIGRFDLHPWTISTAPAWPARCGTCGPRRRLAARGFFWMMHRFSYLEPLSLLFSCLSVLRGLVCDGQASLLLEFDASLLVSRQPQCHVSVMTP
jgi:hypothetical protein